MGATNLCTSKQQPIIVRKNVEIETTSDMQ